MPRLLAASLLLHVLLILLVGRTLQHPHAAPAVIQAMLVEPVEISSGQGVPVPEAAAPAVRKETGAVKGKAAHSAAILPRSATKLPVRPAAENKAVRQPVGDKPAQFTASPAPRVETVPPGGMGAHTAAPRERTSPPGASAGNGPGAAAAGKVGLPSTEGGHAAGKTTAAVKPTSSGASTAKKENYQAVLKRLIESHKKYPVASRRRHEEGSCQRRLVLGRDGALRQVESLTRCGYPFLDEAATQAIVSVGKFPPLPDEIEGTEVSFTIKITFALTNG